MGKTLEELEKMPCMEELYLRSLQSNLDIIAEHMESMMLGEQYVKCTKYQNKKEVLAFHVVLQEYDEVYDETIHDRAGLKKMPRLDSLWVAPNTPRSLTMPLSTTYAEKKTAIYAHRCHR